MLGTYSHTRRLKERLTIRNETTTELGGGATETTWSDVATVRGRVRPLKGREYLQARQTVGGTPYEVTIRYPLPTGASLTGDDRLVWHARTGDTTLHLTSPPALMEDNRYYRFMAVEKEV